MREAKKKAKDKKEEENGSQVPVVPMAGAVVIASVLGGPVCLMAGIKLGMVAALGGGIMGYTTGRLIEEHGEAESLMKGEYKDAEEEEAIQLLEYQTDVRRCRFDTLGKSTPAHRAGAPTAREQWVAPARWVSPIVCPPL